jgi:competence protein ComGC
MRAGESYESPPTKSARAFTMTELLLILAGLAILAVIFLPALARSNARSSKLGCSNNLKQVGLAFRTWAIDNNEHFPMQVSVTNEGTMELTSSEAVFPHFLVMSNELSTPKILVCPADEERTYATNFTSGLSDKNISYFVDLDSVPADGAGLLCGDRNLANKPAAGGRFVSVSNGTSIGWTKDIHSRKGYLCFGDGRVEGVRNGGPLTTVRMPEGVTHRLAIP